MFTGIVEEVGSIVNKVTIGGGIRLTIQAKKILEDLNIGDSINVEGVCQTAVELSKSEFSVEAVGETLEKTTLGNLKVNQKVNLERPLSPVSRMGGHFVQGHVNGMGKVTQWFSRGENYFLEIAIPEILSRYTVLEGSIAADGISLTIAHLTGNLIGINIIPHTVQNTSLQFKKIGDPVNIEVDMLAKYIEKLLTANKKSESLNLENLKRWGY
jgi:riboflavin synthase